MRERPFNLSVLDDQHLQLQRDALKLAGCEKIIEEKASGGKANRIGLAHLLELLRPGDTVVIWHLDRLGRCATELREQMLRAGLTL